MPPMSWITTLSQPQTVVMLESIKKAGNELKYLSHWRCFNRVRISMRVVFIVVISPFIVAMLVSIAVMRVSRDSTRWKYSLLRFSSKACAWHSFRQKGICTHR